KTLDKGWRRRDQAWWLRTEIDTWHIVEQEGIPVSSTCWREKCLTCRLLDGGKRHPRQAFQHAEKGITRIRVSFHGHQHAGFGVIINDRHGATSEWQRPALLQPSLSRALSQPFLQMVAQHVLANLAGSRFGQLVENFQALGPFLLGEPVILQERLEALEIKAITAGGKHQAGTHALAQALVGHR